MRSYPSNYPHRTRAAVLAAFYNSDKFGHCRVSLYSPHSNQGFEWTLKDALSAPDECRAPHFSRVASGLVRDGLLGHASRTNQEYGITVNEYWLTQKGVDEVHRLIKEGDGTLKAMLIELQ